MSNELTTIKENGLEVFSNDELGSVRVITLNGEPMFALTDVCKILGIGNTSQIKTRLNPKGIISNETLTNGGKQMLTFINESNLYKAILQSRKKEAVQFSDWITDDILPSIRKIGSYSISAEDSATLRIMHAKDDTERVIALRDFKDAVTAPLVKTIEEQQPKVEFANQICAAKTAINIGAFAKICTDENDRQYFGQNALFKWLRDEGYLFYNKLGCNEPYQKWIKQGYFTYTEKSSSNGQIFTVTLITPKGQKYIGNKITEYFRDRAAKVIPLAVNMS